MEAGEVPATLLTELQAEIVAARERPQDEAHAEAVRGIAERMQMPLEETERGLEAIEPQPTVMRELLMRRVAEAWLEGQRKAYQRGDGASGYA